MAGFHAHTIMRPARVMLAAVMLLSVTHCATISVERYDGIRPGLISCSHYSPVQDAREILSAPIFTLFNVVILRLVWDHRDYWFSGLVNTGLDLLAFFPGYNHYDEKLIRSDIVPEEVQECKRKKLAEP